MRYGRLYRLGRIVETFLDKSIGCMAIAILILVLGLFAYVTVVSVNDKKARAENLQSTLSAIYIESEGDEDFFISECIKQTNLTLKECSSQIRPSE